ncbi:MAG: tetratricopeptide repeat protein, partial [Oceanobacter sp.]
TLARHHLGRLYNQLKRYEEAVTWLQQATGDRYYEGRPGAFNDLALNYFRLGKLDEAIDSYRQTLRLAPYNPDALVNLSTLLFERQEYKESQKYFDRLDRLVQRESTLHTSHSLWLGIRLNTIFQNTAKVIGLAKELQTRFPKSNEYRLYQKSLSDASAKGSL